MNAAVLCIGTELTRGEINNTNATWLAEQLTALGIEVDAIEVVPDEPRAIEQCLARLARTFDAIVCTGGLGPTTDDITAACAARAAAVGLERDAASLERIRQRLEQFGRTLAASNAKQADFPQGSVILENPHGTAPGFELVIGSARCFFMPGVPREMKPMFERFVAARLQVDESARPHQVRLKTFGMAESAVNDALAGIETAHDVVIGYRAHFPEIEVKVLARGADAAARALAAADVVRARLGPAVFAEGDCTLAEVVGELLLRGGRRLALAESCTGGLLSELVTERPGASRFFVGSVVAYSNELKQRWLGVSEALLAEHGAVSSEVASAMARGALHAFGADAALSVTGIAGPDGGSPEKPVGLVFYAAATAERCVVGKLTFPAPRSMVQRMAAYKALWLLRELLSS
jgi:nicotinamide-nucleotide amidase